MDTEHDPLFHSDIEAVSNNLHPGSLTARLLKVAEPGNVRRNGMCCSIRLCPEWPKMLHALPALGRVLIATKNSGAVLGERRAYPAMRFGDNFLRAQSADGRLDAEFIPWNSAFIACHTHENCSTHSIEFHDETGTVLHKVCLMEDSSRDLFVDWVEQHQAVAGETRAKTPIPAGRWSTVQQRHWFDYDEVETLPDHALEGILRFAVGQEFPLQVVVGNEGIVHGAEMIPLSISARPPWIFASDDVTGLHFDPSQLDEHIVHHVRISENSPQATTVKSFAWDGSLSLALTASPHQSEAEWAAFLNQAIKNL